MNRRDTVIIAVLLNAGLLIVLFATSVKTNKVQESTPAVQMLAVSSRNEVKKPSPVTPPLVAAQADEVNQLVGQYVTPEIKETPPPNFSADLYPLGEPLPLVKPSEKPPCKPLKPSDLTSKAASFEEVKIKKGDALDKIAKKHHVTTEEIIAINHLPSTQLKIGQILKIPLKETAINYPFKPHREENKYHVIKAGDSPWSIAIEHKMKLDELLKINNLSEEKAKRLKPGERLRIQ